MRNIKHGFFALSVLALSIPAFVFGQGFANPLKPEISSVAGFTSEFLRAVIFIVFPIAVVFIVYSGFLFVFAQGKPEELSKAKTNFFWTLVGVALLLGATALAALIKGTIDPILGN